MADQVCKSEASSVLLVEGVNDCHVIMALCEHHKVDEKFGIYECGGDQLLLKRLNALISSSDQPETIGVVLDADSPDAHGRWVSLRQKLDRYHYEFPDFAPVEGAIIFSPKERPKLGIWLMPDNQESGMLEDFCARMIDEKAGAVAERCVRIAQAEGVWATKPVHFRKSVVHTFLAWQDVPGRPLGQAITQQALRGDSELATAFVQWLRRLFVDGTRAISG